MRVAGLIGERVCLRLRGTIARRPPPAAVRGVALAAAAAALAVFGASLFVRYPELPLYVAPNRPSAAEYMRQAVLACATFLRFGRPDWLTSVTFFAGFGWLDSVPAVHLVSTIASASGMMLVLLLVWAARMRSLRTLVWLGFAVVGFLASAAVYALSLHGAMASDLHGRYLLGLYLCALAICWTGAGRTAGAPGSRLAVAFTTAAVTCAIAIHVYSLRLILSRYFSKTHVSFEPPPWLLFTTSEPFVSAVRVRPPGRIHVELPVIM